MTVEEKAKKYADDVAFLVPYDGTMNFYDEKRLKTAKIDYLAGHNEAMRWRDPKEELPEEVGLYLCKCKSNRLGFYFEIVFFNKVWRSDKVIGWRPIE